MLTIGQERRGPMEINIGDSLYAVAFSVNGEYVLSGGLCGVRVWRVEDGNQVARMEADYVQCLAVSRNGRWIAAGTRWGEVRVWDATTYNPVFARNEDSDDIYGVDFSPDSTRLVSASNSCKAIVWDIATRSKVQTLDRDGGGGVIAAKYSPQGDRIATASRNSVRVYDSNDGRLLAEIRVRVTPWYNSGLLWFSSCLLVVSDGKVKQIEASTGSVVLEWTVPNSVNLSCIALPKHGNFIAYSTERAVTLWDTSTHTWLGLIQHPQDIGSIAHSPDDKFIAIGGEYGKIVIESLYPLSVSSASWYCWIMTYLNNFIPKSRWHTMLGIYSRARTTRRAAFGMGRSQ